MRNFYLTTVIFLVLVFSSTNIYSQLLPTDDLRDENLGCNSNNYTILEVFLADVNGNELGACTPGQTVNAYLWVRYESNANSTVSAFTIFSDLITNYQDTNIPSTIEFYQECIDELVSSNTGINEVLIAPLPWNCGDKLILSNTTLGWITSGSGVNCNNVQIEDYNKAQCDNVGDILVNAPLIANFIHETDCISDFTIDFTSTTTGGLVANSIDDLITNPYIYTWDWGHPDPNSTTGPTIPMPSDQIFSHTFPSAGTYYVTLTVRDTDTPFSENTTIPMEIIVNPPLSIAETHTNPFCHNSLNGLIDITVTGGLAPYTFDWDNDGFEDPDNDSEDLTSLSAGTYTVIVTDANECTAQKTIIILNGDNTPPTASNPSDINIQCIGDIPDPNNDVVTDESDDSGALPIVAWVSDSSDGLSCPETITRTYSVTDACNNQILVTQAIIINDTTNPTASNPAAIPVQCIGDVPAQDISVVTDANDNCPIAPVVAWVSDSSDGLSCPETITRTYSVTDACNNQILVTQAIIINDTTNPTASNPAAIPVQCIGDVPAQDISVVTDANDNCPIAPVVAWVSDSSDGLSCPETITRTYSVTDACNNQILVTQAIIINDTTAPDITSCNLNLNTPSTCDAATNESIADQWNLDNIAALQACVTDNCDTDLTINSNYDFVNLNQECGPCGTLSVTYNVLDDCGNNSPITLNLSFNDNTPPDLTNCSVGNETLECDGTNNEAIADQWNLDNIAALEACAEDDTDITVTSNYAFVNLNTTCGLGGVIPVLYTITDECGGAAILNVTLTLEDTTPPDLSGCAVTSQTLECDGINNEAIADQWNLDNIAALEGCVGDSCDPDFSGQVTSDYAYSNLSSTCGLGGTIAVIYTITDDCGNAETLNATLTLEDTTPPDLSGCAVTSQALECDGVNNEAIADQWNLDNIAALEGCVADSCDPDFSGQVTSDYAFSNLSSTCGLGGTIAVIYTITDDCGNAETLNATLTLEDTTPPDLSGCAVTSQTLECDGVNNEAIADQWNLDNIAALEGCVADSCDPDFSGQVTSDYAFSNLSSTCGLGGTTAVVYTVVDDCNNEITLSVTLTLEDTTPPDLSGCAVTNQVLECTDDNQAAADAWNEANIAALEACVSDSCDPDFSGQVTSDYDFANLNTTCGPCGTLNVNYTITDDCGNSSTLNAILSFDDITIPDLSNCNVNDLTLECDGTNNETLADQWNLDNIAALETCADDLNITVSSNYAFTNLVTSCGLGGTIPVTYTVTDDCDNSATLNVILTLEDTTPPDLVNCTVTDETLECAGDDNESIADAWNNANITALQTCGTDSCDVDNTFVVTSDYDFANLSVTCGLGGTMTVIYTITDDCGNSQRLIATLTLTDTTAPVLTLGDDGSAECTGTDPAMNLAYIDWVSSYAGITATDNCGSVTLSFNEGQWTNDGCSDSIIVTFFATDECGLQGEVIQRSFTIADTTAPEITPEIDDVVFYCNELPPVPTFDVIEGCSEANIEYNVTITGTEGTPDYQILRNWIITDECGNQTIKEQLLLVEPGCNCLEDMFISKAITPNGDIYNDYFKVEGIDDCGIPTLKMFNRWGNLVYLSDDYDSKKGRWRGTAENGGTTLGSNNKLPTGTYYYIIKIRNTNIKAITGHVYLSTN